MKRSEESRKRTKFLFTLIILTAILCITATYAWFTVQRNVSVSGLRVEVGVEDNMLISLDGDNWTRTITIEDMRQLLGTYEPENTDTVIYQAAKGDNKNYVPTKLMPVSTDGTVEDGKIQFATGRTVGGNKLTDIKLCTEDDIGTEKTVNDKHPFLVFDLYVKNISPNTQNVGNPETFQLNKGSQVVALNDETGLEAAVRVGLVAYENTGNLLDVGSTLRALQPDESDKVAIWEPNYKMHTDAVRNSDSRITANLCDFETQALKIDKVTEGDINDITNGGERVTAVHTNKVKQADNVDGRTQEPATLEATKLTDTSSADFKIDSNSVTKMRVYVWIEGQDPDCVDDALEGKEIEIVLNFAMPITES